MFDLMLTLCLAAAPAECHDRRGSDGPPVPLVQCQRNGSAQAVRMARDSGAELRQWRCVRTAPAPLAVREIAPGVFVHQGQHDEPTPDNQGDLSNMGFVVGARSVAAIDASGSVQVAARMLATIRQKTDLPVSHLILTHMHPDHVFGAKVFADAGAVVIGHRKLKPALQARAETYRENIERLIGPAAFAGSEIVLPSEAVAGITEIDLGGRILRLEAHRTAHTDNDLSVFDAETGTWFLGDLLFADHTPAVDGSLLGWIEVLGTLRERPASRAVPGHGPASVDWPEGADPLHRYLTMLAEEIRGAIRTGRTLSEAVENIGWQARGDWELFDEFHPRNVTTGFQELEWE